MRVSISCEAVHSAVNHGSQWRSALKLFWSPQLCTCPTALCVLDQKGDRFETHCYYDTAFAEYPDEDVSFGLGSENEM